jgi:hypothetical protein
MVIDAWKKAAATLLEFCSGAILSPPRMKVMSG